MLDTCRSRARNIVWSGCGVCAYRAASSNEAGIPLLSLDTGQVDEVCDGSNDVFEGDDDIGGDDDDDEKRFHQFEEDLAVVLLFDGVKSSPCFTGHVPPVSVLLAASLMASLLTFLMQSSPLELPLLPVLVVLVANCNN